MAKDKDAEDRNAAQEQVGAGVVADKVRVRAKVLGPGGFNQLRTAHVKLIK
ncbi:hypothetical protein Dtox_2161 [Desulfofarcimen acetoxidans DSM 771]|jgi:hypothetical protein|uniref:Uncharacterized protein n=1 Tax=Desulfofarcimen acetoxidans (strain ATCC 49208 / DSM 771 / KCTC 5769 / VKM B-1644 / 5575) TaxID=485916 RepID=C8VZ75_DESAS|nr:hypothetical protein Dtox_2161 [Desulfofarcimen acetoxidans DSM 771]